MRSELSKWAVTKSGGSSKLIDCEESFHCANWRASVQASSETRAEVVILTRARKSWRSLRAAWARRSSSTRFDVEEESLCDDASTCCREIPASVTSCAN